MKTRSNVSYVKVMQIMGKMAGERNEQGQGISGRMVNGEMLAFWALVEEEEVPIGLSEPT